MSKANSGLQTNGKSRLLPLPASGIAHCVLLLPQPGDYLQSFLKALEHRLPGVDPIDPSQWAVAAEPRPVSYGIVTRGAWRWHLLIDPGGMPPEVAASVMVRDFGDKVERGVECHQVCVLAFLLDAPEEATSLDKMRALCEVAWAWFDLGAEVLAFPEGRTAATREILMGIEPQHIQAEHSYLFVSNGLDRVDKASTRHWVRTWGMAQFGLPDLCAAVDTSKPVIEEELASLRLLFETLPPTMIKDHGILPLGGEVTIGERVWTASKPPDQAPKLASRFGLCYFE